MTAALRKANMVTKVYHRGDPEWSLWDRSAAPSGTAVSYGSFLVRPNSNNNENG
jgi:hypothetical protein